MLILLYGRTASGKSTLAEKLVRQTGATHMPVDAVRAQGYTGLAAQARLIFDAREAQGDVIVECCSPTPRLAEMADLIVLVEVSDSELIWRLRRRGWTRQHIGRALRERYATTPDITVECGSQEQLVDAIEAVVGALPITTGS